MKNLKCKICGYEWAPRNTEKKPKACPRCKRYDWDGKPELPIKDK